MSHTFRYTQLIIIIDIQPSIYRLTSPRWYEWNREPLKQFRDIFILFLRKSFGETSVLLFEGIQVKIRRYLYMEQIGSDIPVVGWIMHAMHGWVMCFWLVDSQGSVIIRICNKETILWCLSSVLVNEVRKAQSKWRCRSHHQVCADMVNYSFKIQI